MISEVAIGIRGGGRSLQGKTTPGKHPSTREKWCIHTPCHAWYEWTKREMPQVERENKKGGNQRGIIGMVNAWGEEGEQGRREEDWRMREREGEEEKPCREEKATGGHQHTSPDAWRRRRKRKEKKKQKRRSREWEEKKERDQGQDWWYTPSQLQAMEKKKEKKSKEAFKADWYREQQYHSRR